MSEQDQQQARREKVEACLQRLEDGFRRRWDNNPDFRKSLQGKDRDILIDLKQTGSWWLKVRDGDLEAIVEGDRKDPDVSIQAKAGDFVDVFDGDLSPIEAYMKRKIKVDAGFRDIMLVKKFVG